MLVDVIRDIFPRLGVSPDSVFGAIEGHELGSAHLAKQIDRATQTAIDGRRIGDQADLPPLDQVESLLQKDLESRLDPLDRRGFSGRSGRP